MTRIGQYLHNVFVAVDQLINALFDGWADETLSAHAHRLHRDGKPFGILRWVYDALFIWQSGRLDHCARAYESERLRMQAPPETRSTTAASEPS